SVGWLSRGSTYNQPLKNSVADEGGPLMDANIQSALQPNPIVEMSTQGRKSGEARRIEMPLRLRAGRIFISGRPGKRSWYANILGDPHVTIHVKSGAAADLSVRG